MKVTDEGLDELIKWAEFRRRIAAITDNWVKLIFAFKELQSLRKGVEEAIEEIKQYKKNVIKGMYDDDSIPELLITASDNALYILKKHVSKYLEEEQDGKRQ